MRAFVLLLALSGCGTGMMWGGMGPPPVLPRPGVGLPLPVHPGERERPPLPPSPNKRILPATREPGIWAADGAVTGTVPQIAGVPIVPVPDPKGTILAVDTGCVESMDRLLTRDKHARGLALLRAAYRRCLAAGLYAHCVTRNAEIDNAIKKKHADNLKTRTRARQANYSQLAPRPTPEEQAAGRIRAEYCRDASIPEELFQSVVKAFEGWE